MNIVTGDTLSRFSAICPTQIAARATTANETAAALLNAEGNILKEQPASPSPVDDIRQWRSSINRSLIADRA